MSDRTGIEWTDHTFNPWWGCVKVSPGCRFCYADSLSSRYGFDVWGAKKPRRFFGDKHWLDPVKWNAQSEHDTTTGKGLGRRHRVFCASMADVFEDRRDLDPWRERLWALIAETPWLDWQLLTKRPEHMRELAPLEWYDEWPAHVWAGTSAEDQRWLEKRLPALAEVPAVQRFLSIEPMLGPVDLSTEIAFDEFAGGFAHGPAAHLVTWVIVGGESGPRHRPFELRWASEVRDQCQAYHLPFFFKQVGGRTNKAGGKLLDGRVWAEFPASLAVANA